MSTSEVPAFGFADVVAKRRLINDSIAKGAHRIDEDSRFEYLCECGDQACRRAVELTAAQFSACRPGAIVANDSAPTTFAPTLREAAAEA